jgi:hypothetical protein
MATLFGRTPKSTLQELLTVNNNSGITTDLNQIGDGQGGLSPLAISNTKVSLNDMVWPTAGALTNSVLRVSSTTNQLEWVAMTPANFTNLWNKAGDTMTGALTLASDPTQPLQAATKQYIDAKEQTINGKLLNKTGDTMTGALTLASDPTQPLHASSKQYVDSLVQGLDGKASVRVATTANITLSGTPVIDGIQTVVGDRVLVKNQTAGAQNGIYDVSAGAWSRSADADNVPGQEVSAGMYTFVEDGTTQAATGWNLVTKTLTLGTTPLVFTQFGAAVNYTAGTNVAINGTVISVPNSNIPYDIASAILGKPEANATVMRFVSVRSFSVPTNFAGSIAKADVTGTSTSTIFSIRKNGTQFGTMTFAAGTVSATFSGTSTSFVAGDIITIVAPASQNSTLADVQFTMVASLA